MTPQQTAELQSIARMFYAIPKQATDKLAKFITALSDDDQLTFGYHLLDALTATCGTRRATRQVQSEITSIHRAAAPTWRDITQVKVKR